MRASLVLIIGAVAIAGCYSTADLHSDAELAKQQTLEVRPRANLADVDFGFWRDVRDINDAETGIDGYMTSKTVRAVIDEQAPLLLRLGVLMQGDFKAMDELPSSGDAALALAFAVPERGIVRVKRSAAGREGMFAHELAHVANHRFGYQQGWPIPTGAGETIDARWVDADALLAAWALEEATAELTELFVKIRQRRMPGGTRPLWDSLVPDDTYSSATVEQEGLALKVLDLLYVQAMSVIATRAPWPVDEKGETDLDAAFALTWEKFSFTTREVLFPRLPAESSRLLAKFRSLGIASRVGGATRVGAFFVRELIMRSEFARLGLDDGQPVPLERWLETEGYVKLFHDDLLLRDDADSLLWITRWEMDAAAEWFAEVYRAQNPDADVSREGLHTIIRLGAFKDAAQITRELTID